MDQRCSCKWFITERSKVAKNVTRTFCFYQQRPEQKLRENISSEREFFFQTIDIQWNIKQGISVQSICYIIVHISFIYFWHRRPSQMSNFCNILNWMDDLEISSRKIHFKIYIYSWWQPSITYPTYYMFYFISSPRESGNFSLSSSKFWFCWFIYQSW